MISLLQYCCVGLIGIILPLFLHVLLYSTVIDWVIWSFHTTSAVYAQDWDAQSDIELSPFMLNMIWKNSRWDKDAFRFAIKRLITSRLMMHWFSWFASKYPGYTLSLAADTIEFIWSWVVNNNPDSLDFWIIRNILPKSSNTQVYFKEWLSLSHSVYNQWTNINLFQSTEDLRQLGFQVVSYRSRINNDDRFRRENIRQAFFQFGNIRIINPGEEVSFYHNIAYDPREQKNYQKWRIISWDEEIVEYGGGICGASTAVYQGMITNKSLERTQVRNHSKWYHRLYSATINGEYIKTPGIDSTLYSGNPDLKFKNTSLRPIIVISNYDWTKWWKEENFTLGTIDDKGSIEYISSYGQRFNLWWNIKQWRCYIWKINWTERKSCYNELK